MITVIAGGVGAARFLRGLLDVVPAPDVAAVVNVADDFVLHGLHISPDLDTCTYTLAGAINGDTGWGRAGESWAVMDELERYGGHTWFRLGDRDLALHLYRTQRRDEGATLSTVTAEVARAWRIGCRLLPVSDDPIATRVDVAGEGEMDFQTWFVANRHSLPVSSVRFEGADLASPAPGVVDAILGASTVVIAPSNPIVSIGPVLAVPGIRAAVQSVRARSVAVSPIVGGRALKGPADRLLTELGHEASVVGVARLYAPLASRLVIDHVDADLAGAVAACGIEPVVTATVMSDAATAAALASTCLAGTAP